MHRCLIPVTIAFIAGITVGTTWPGHWPLALSCALVTGIGLIRAAWRRDDALLCPILFFVAIGYASIQPWLGAEAPVNHVSRFADQGLWTIRGQVAGTPSWKGRRLQFVMAATTLGSGAQHHVVCGKVKVSARGRLPELHRGDEVVLTGRLRAIRSFANPGGFDYARFMRLRDIRVRIYARKGTLTVLKTVVRMPWQGKVDALRQLLADRMDTAVADRGVEASALLKALIIGQRDLVDLHIRQDFNKAGVSHVLAISGLHIGMVAAAAFGLSRWLMCWFPMMLARGWTRKGAAVVSFAAVLFYALLAGMSPSTQRATIMVAVVLLGCWVGRRHDWLNGLAIAALMILMVHPPALLSISFQLSFCAVLFIVVGLTAVSTGTRTYEMVWWRRWIQRWVAFMLVSAMAILGTLPLALFYFNQTSLVGLATNLVVVPLVGMVVIPAGLLGVLVSMVSPFLAGWFWTAATMALDVILWVVHTVAQCRWSSVQTVTPAIYEILLYYVSFGVILGWRKLPRPGLAVMVICALWVVDAAYWYHQRFGRQDMRVTAIDVGQGTANLLQLPGGYTVLVDGGGFSDNRVFDVGQRVVAPLLWRKKIKRVDLVVLSHPNSDHLNGLLYILRHFNVSEIWSNHRPATTWGYRKWSKLIHDYHIKHSAFDDLPRRQVRHGVALDILGPPQGFIHQIGTEPWRDHNNCSLVLQVGFGRVTFLFAGDIIAPAEADLIRRHNLGRLKSTILMVPHHGSRYSSTEAFLGAIAPTEAIISSGWSNRFGFPHAQVLQRLETVGARIWSTSYCGAVQIVTDGQNYRISAMRPKDGGDSRLRNSGAP